MARRRKYTRALGLAQAGDVSPVWGVAASGAAGTGTAVAIRATTTMDKNAELIGMGVGTLTGLALMMSQRTRAAGFTGVVTAIVNNGLRFLEASLSDKQKIKDIAGSLASKAAKDGTPLKAQLNIAKGSMKTAGLGIVSPEVIRSLSGGFGAVQATAVPSLGAVQATAVPSLGAVQASVMPSFGAAAASPMPLAGGLGGLGAHYGATGSNGGID